MSSDSMSSLALAPLTSLSTHLDALITSLVQTNTFAAAPAAASSLIADDDALTSALATLRQHQQNYARILHLREEAQRLEDELKNVIRKAVSLRDEVGRICPSVLDDDYWDDEDEDGGTHTDATAVEASVHVGEGQEVDYHTLLNFASRIGKHNSLAAQEAERESDRRKIAAMKDKSPNNTAVSGTLTTNAEDGVPGIDSAANTNANTEERQQQQDVLSLQAQDLENQIARTRAEQGMAFPNPEMLRWGVLGRLQKLREDAGDRGEEVVDSEIERMVRESEVVAPPQLDVLDEDESRRVEDDNPKTATSAASRPRRESASQRANATGAGPSTTAPRRKLQLDLPIDDDDEEEDDD